MNQNSMRLGSSGRCHCWVFSCSFAPGGVVGAMGISRHPLMVPFDTTLPTLGGRMGEAALEKLGACDGDATAGVGVAGLKCACGGEESACACTCACWCGGSEVGGLMRPAKRCRASASCSGAAAPLAGCAHASALEGAEAASCGAAPYCCAGAAAGDS